MVGDQRLEGHVDVIIEGEIEADESFTGSQLIVRQGVNGCKSVFTFFFSSRRRHTMSYGDWSSDVCSSDLNLYNAAGSFKALCEGIRPLGRTWAAELTIDLAEKPELLKLAYASGCRDLFLGIESVSQTAIDGLDKWSNDTTLMKERVRRVHDAGINVMGAFVFGLDGDDHSSFDRTLEFISDTGIDFVVANIIQPYPGTGTFKDAVDGRDFLPCAACPSDSDVAMDYNWPLFDGAHVLLRPKRMTVEQLQEGYYYFLREVYSLTGILRRFRGGVFDLP